MQSWKQKCPPSYHHNGFVRTHGLGYMTHGYPVLVPMNQRVFNKLSKKRNINGHKWSTTHRVVKSHKRRMDVICIQSWKQCALLVITTMALCQLMHLGTWCMVTLRRLRSLLSLLSTLWVTTKPLWW